MASYDVRVITILLTIFIILVIFCFMYKFIYHNQSINFVLDNTDNDNYIHIHKMNDYVNDSDINISINNQIDKLFNYIEKNRKPNIKENFLLDNNDINTYTNNLITLKTHLNTYQAKDIENIKKTIKTIVDQRNLNKQQILDLLTNIYMIRYIERMNQINAISYKQYLKYINPKDNKFYNA